MRYAIPTIIGYDVVSLDTAAIIAPVIATREDADRVAQENNGVVVPVLSTLTRRIGYALPAVAAP